ncbi:galanin peptides-like isoform X2 [Protopterus annectens]|uniref:galanin peptides-like isoform X2 n=1 Tax=Protopterus annectens TaxID=7888 RepID=UPI001CFAA3D1|nr:galanin peptides-like isoform X2 [Protopterus annectens]
MLQPSYYGKYHKPKDKRGWTLNSAGYLLGPRVTIRTRPMSRFQGTTFQRARKHNAHRTLNDKGGLAGKRDTMEEVYKTAGEPFSNPLHSLDDSTLQLVLDFLSYLHLKELGALENLNLPFSSEESTQP